jgi:hypothetical protein
LEELYCDGASEIKSYRFSWQQLLMILSFQFNIPVMAPHFSQCWDKCTGEDLIELAFYLQMSDVCNDFEQYIKGSSVSTWLEDLRCLDWQSAIDDTDWQSVTSSDEQDERRSGDSRPESANNNAEDTYGGSDWLSIGCISI